MNINWGIIGCGDVTEIKSGPAFYKVAGSSLYAVMRRDATKAADYAARHHVPVFYTDALQLIQDVNVQAIYIATPPNLHEQYALAAIDAGKPVYVEKPMTLNADSAKKMTAYANQKGVKLVVAHYRNAQPIFLKVKQLLADNTIGEVHTAQIDYSRKAPTATELQHPSMAWRLDPKQSGGGLFHDLAPHQLGLMQFFFGDSLHCKGFSSNHNKAIRADDLVTGMALFNHNIHFFGNWDFNAAPHLEKDVCFIRGTKGSIEFSVFNNTQIRLSIHNKAVEEIDFDPLPHVQQPMIERVVQYFKGNGENPCSPESAVSVMQMMDSFVTKENNSVD
jgi:predicted dehydrogenase